MIDNGNSHLYGMIAQQKANSLAAGTTTTSIPEGTNLYFTSARARNVFTVQSPLNYVPATGTLSVTGYTGTVTVLVDVDFVAQTKTTKTLTYSNGVLTSVS